MNAVSEREKYAAAAHVRVEKPVKLPGNIEVADATDEQLRACLRDDQLWLYGGPRTVEGDEGETQQTVGFLADPSRHSTPWESAEDYLARADRYTADYRVVRRTWLRIQAVTSELAKRDEQKHVETQHRREHARSRLDSWREDVPKIVGEFQAAAQRAVINWQLVEPIAAAMQQLQSVFPSPMGSLSDAYERLRARVRELDPSAEPLPDLPDGLPSHEQVRRAASVLAMRASPGSRVPSTGLERINFERTLRDAREE